MKIALIQTEIKTGDIGYNFAHVEALLREAAKNADILVLPELWNTGFFPKEKLSLLADKDASRTKKLLSDTAARYGACIVGGSVAEKKDGRIYNTCYIYNEKGENVASYSKTHLFSYMNEHLYFSPGDTTGQFTLFGIKCAVAVCYDVRFPELIRKYAVDGIGLLFTVCQWPAERTDILHTLAAGRAAENQMYVAVCNSCAENCGTVFGGKSAVFDPLGRKTAEAGETEEIIYCDIDMSRVKTLRDEFRVFADRRTDIY